VSKLLALVLAARLFLRRSSKRNCETARLLSGLQRTPPQSVATTKSGFVSAGVVAGRAVIHGSDVDSNIKDGGSTVSAFHDSALRHLPPRESAARENDVSDAHAAPIPQNHKRPVQKARSVLLKMFQQTSAQASFKNAS
jgi:hypothetical protein